MPNKNSAIEWLKKAYHNLSAGELLYNANHYADTIAVEIHYSIEKTLKAFLAYENKKIPKTHDLLDIYDLITEHINLNEYEDMLDTISKYHIEASYPAFHRHLPSFEELKEALNLATDIFTKTCKILDINKEDIK